MNNQTSQDTSIKATDSFFQKLLKDFKDFLIALCIIFFSFSFIAIPFQIDGTSMEGNYHNHEFVLVNRFGYLDFSTHFSEWTKENSNIISKTVGGILSKIPIHIGDPKRGDVVVLRPGVDGVSEFFLKRVIAIPGDTIRLLDGKVFIKTKDSQNFVEIKEPYLLEKNQNRTYLPHNVYNTDFLVPEGKYWVMGDNRTNSGDSRNCFKYCEDSDSPHFAERYNIVGKPVFSFGYFAVFERKNFPAIGSLSWEVKPQGFSLNNSAEYPELE